MPLLNDVKAILDRLAPHGWQAVFASHGLDITVPLASLAAELSKILTVDRTRPGFEEFAFDGKRGVEPGIPGLSLLYHALASADVHPQVAPPNPADYPILADLDTIENYIYSVAKRSLASFSNPVLTVVAYQYREKSLSPHRRHADLGFSRTGVARVGNEQARYNAPARSFDPRPALGDRGFAAVPARYALFIGELRTPRPEDQVLRQVSTDAGQMFVFPVHKIFPGNECLVDNAGAPLVIPNLSYQETHINEKLRRIHRISTDNPGRVPPLAMFNINQPPFIRVTPAATDLVRLQNAGASVMVVPVDNPIVRTASQLVGGVTEIARFRVPPQNSNNRFWTSLQISATNAGRAAPEYANMRQQVVNNAGTTTIVDLNLVPNAGTPAPQRFDAKLAAGNYEAAHFIDSTCDGVLTCQVPAPLASLTMFPAYSLVSAVDYFPQVEQVEVLEWIESLDNSPIGLGNPAFHFDQGGPEPLSDGRFTVSATGNLTRRRRVPNQELKNPLAPANPAFPSTEAANRSATAIVGRAATGGSSTRTTPSPFYTSWLPDAASDVFAPGWDTSQHTVAGTETYATYGLGSPFPEDAKLCAALNSFWPAAAPDASRTYGFFVGSPALLPTGIPMTDSELGYNTGHPRAVAGEVGANFGWDGDTGPFLTRHDGQTWVNASNPNRADETRAAFNNQIGFSGLDALTSSELIERMEDLRFCRQNVLPIVTSAEVWLVTVETVPAWAAWVSGVSPPLAAGLAGRGRIYVFAHAQSNPLPIGDPPLRQEFQVISLIEIHLDRTQAFVRKSGGAVQQVART